MSFVFFGLPIARTNLVLIDYYVLQVVVVLSLI